MAEKNQFLLAKLFHAINMAWSELLFPKHHILKTEWQLIKWETWTLAPLENSPLPLKVVLPGLCTIQPPAKSLCYLYCHFADTIPNSAQVHKLGVGRRLDLWMTKIPYKAIRGLWNFKARRPQEGRLSKDLMSVTFSLSHSPGAWFGGNSIKMFTSYQ